MQKLLLFLFFFFILFFAFLGTLQTQANAQTVTPIAMPTPTPVNYLLPYPGLLPDNPLYKLKVIRDKIVSFLISDPLKKAEFDLLQGDKRLSAAMALLQENPQEQGLVVDTLSKGENYVSQGIDQLTLAKKQGMDISEMQHKFFLSSQKHLEVVRMLSQTIGTNFRESVLQEQRRIEDFQEMVSPVMPNK